MSNTTTQYRISFTQPSANGNVECSTKWFDTIEEAMASKWMLEDNVKIISRQYTAESFPFKHYMETVGCH